MHMERSDSDVGDLARTINEMSVSIDHHRSVIEALSGVDRLLLRSSALEPILDIVLPSIATVLKCASVSVFLNDFDSNKHARAYDYYADAPTKRPARRIEVDVKSVANACQQTLCWWATPEDIGTAPFLAPLRDSGAVSFRLCSLHHDQRVKGLLGVGYKESKKGLVPHDFGVTEFADRLSVVLANNERAEQLHREANFDALTDLPNRRLFYDRMERELTRILETRETGALLYIDIDHFKRINDTAGHSAGDAVLRLAARRIGHCLKDTDTLARLGGDEFAVFLARLPDGNAAHHIAERILQCLQRPVTVSGRDYQISASIGVTRVPADGDSIETLLKRSDIAMYRAKESGRGRAEFYAAEMQDRMNKHTGLEAAVRRAVQQEEFNLAFQPIVQCSSRRVVGLEALLRWPHAPQGAWSSPAVFVAIAEESSLIVDLGAWVLSTACRQFAAWRAQGCHVDFLSVNISARQLREPSLLEAIHATLNRFGISPSELQVEITESVLADGPATDRTLRDLASCGVRLALDDFGTGYSSLSYLRSYPIHTVKVDRSFIADLPSERAACRLVDSIIGMCRGLEKQVIAEGVETHEQLDFLDSVGCGAVQGYLLAVPLAAADVGGYLAGTVKNGGVPNPKEGRSGVFR
jgi:diguanylate cyclase (GGDEF)-like protein